MPPDDAVPAVSSDAADTFVLNGVVQKVPPTKEERNAFIAVCSREVQTLKENGFANGIPQRSQLEETARSIIPTPEYLGWTMVQLGSILWTERVSAVPYNRRLLFLPHCLRNADACPATYSAEGLHCENCGQCEIGKLKQYAEDLGYSVLVAEGSPAVLQWILQRKSDAVLGVGCLRSLERAFSKLLFAGIPALAVPLHASTCRNTETDLDYVHGMICTEYIPDKNKKHKNETQLHSAANKKSNLPLLRAASDLFTLTAGEHKSVNYPEADPKTAVQRIAGSFLCSGGKFYRPFIVLSVFDSLTGSHCTGEDGEINAANLPSLVKDAARAVEMFHKASLVHDDIEDGDNFRYGKPALHTEYGTPAAINIGDYLIGEGYRCIAGIRCAAAAEIVLEMLACLVNAHKKLCEGQGAELAWRKQLTENAGKEIEPSVSEIIEIYVLKTAPAFEAALSIGVLSAVASGKVDYEFYERTKASVARYSRHLGAAFQIRNDLDDFLPETFRQRKKGFDLLRNSPTLLRAFFVSKYVKESADNFEEYRLQMENAGVFSQAEELIRKLKAKAAEAVRSIDKDTVEGKALQECLLEFIDAFDC